MDTFPKRRGVLIADPNCVFDSRDSLSHDGAELVDRFLKGLTELVLHLRSLWNVRAAPDNFPPQMLDSCQKRFCRLD
jgi:hypothetical protein